MTLHTLLRCEFRAATVRQVSQEIALDEAAARVLEQHPGLSTVAVRRLAAVMFDNEPQSIQDTAELIATLSGTDLWSEPTPLFGEEMAHILVVDDEEGVRDVLVSMLEEHGFRATPAGNGIAMREILAGDGLPVNAIVLDCIMPGELGPELALQAKRLRLPVVMISGSPDAVAFADENGLQFLAKPFHFDDLIAAVEKALSSGQFG